MPNQGMQSFAKLLLLLGGAVALVGGLLGFATGFVGAGSALALVVGVISLVYYGRLGSEGVVLILFVLGLILAVITGGIAAVGGVLVSVAALFSLVVRYAKL